MKIFKFEEILDIIDKKGYDVSINTDSSIRVKVKLYEKGFGSIFDTEPLDIFDIYYKRSVIKIEGYEHTIPGDVHYNFKYKSETVEKKGLFITCKKKVGQVFLIFDIHNSTLEEVETFFKQNQSPVPKPLTHLYKGKFVNLMGD